MFKLIAADPPWWFDDNLPGTTRGARRIYECMKTEEICRMPLPPIADDAVLAMWRVASQPQAALDVVRIWGFTPKTELVWLKKTSEGNRWFGMGHITRAEHEICIIATRGRPLIKNHYTRSAFVTGLSAPVGRHSEKPEQFYDILEDLFEGPYCELFARRKRPGWTCIGNEVA